MTTLADFMPAIVADPDCDAVRLKVADWLDGTDGTTACPACTDKRGFSWGTVADCGTCHGEGRVPNGFAERAEFIRVQCELARSKAAGGKWSDTVFNVGDSCECRTCLLRRRERELVKSSMAEWAPVETWAIIPSQHGEAWLRAWKQDGPLNTKMVYQADFSRGFPSRLTLSWQDWQTHAAALLAACPIRRVNKPKECPTCDHGDTQGSPKPWMAACASCHGTGKVGDWKGDGVVRLTTWPPEGPSHSFRGRNRLYGERELTEIARAYYQRGGTDSRGWMADVLGLEYPGVRFELPQYGPSDLRAAKRGYMMLSAGRRAFLRSR